MGADVTDFVRFDPVENYAGEISAEQKAKNHKFIGRILAEPRTHVYLIEWSNGVIKHDTVMNLIFIPELVYREELAALQGKPFVAPPIKQPPSTSPVGKPVVPVAPPVAAASPVAIAPVVRPRLY